MLFDGGPLADQIDMYVAAGLPDPREEIDEIGIGGTIEKLDDDQFVLVTKGSLRVAPVVQFAALPMIRRLNFQGDYEYIEGQDGEKQSTEVRAQARVEFNRRDRRYGEVK